MTLKLIVLLFPALALARIDVELTGTFEKDVQVGLSGHDVNIISNTEIDSFDLSSRNLKTGVEGYFGQWPTDVYLKSPTPWGDLYKTYGWKQVVRTLVPFDGRVIGMTSEPQILMYQIFENNSSLPGTYNVGISQTVENTMTSSWSLTHELSISETIKVELNLLILNIGSETTLGFTTAWGTTTEKSQTVTVGATSNLEIELQPGQQVVAQLEASRGTMKIEVDYEATVNGDVATNYEKTYKGHHFWALPLGPIMEKAGLTNSVKSKQVIEFGFFTNSKVVVQDLKTDAKILDVGF